MENYGVAQYKPQSYYDRIYGPDVDVTQVDVPWGIWPGVNATEPVLSNALDPSQQAFNFQSRAPFGSNPPDRNVPYTAEGGPGEGTFQSGSGAAKPWEASDAQMMVGMMGSNMFPTRDQPRIMGDSGGSGGGMAKGAIQGAMIGSKFGSPWWGAAIGGGLGALGMFDTTTPPQIIPAQIKRGSRTAFPQVPPMASYYPGLLNA